MCWYVIFFYNKFSPNSISGTHFSSANDDDDDDDDHREPIVIITPVAVIILLWLCGSTVALMHIVCLPTPADLNIIILLFSPRWSV